MSDKKRVIVIGSGPAGYSSALYSARANYDVTLISGYNFGGQLTTTNDVDNWIGGHEGMTGSELMQNMNEHAKRFGVKVVEDQIYKVDLSKRPFTLYGDFEDTYECDALIIATGSSAKYLNIESERRLFGNGISGCATCDGFFYKDMSVVVVGGGNTAVEEAIYLSTIASKVTLIHRGDSLRAEAILQDTLNSRENISVLYNEEVDEFVGTPEFGLISVKLQSGIEIDANGAFIAIGHNPNTAFLNHQLELKDGGYIVTHSGTHTSVEGVFACGDVMDNVYRQAIVSAGTGCMASLDAQRFLEKN